MIAVVYSGSNNAGWRLSAKGRTVASFNTNAINPYFNDEKYIIQLLNKNINLIHHAEEIKRIYFFGAGASSTELKHSRRSVWGMILRQPLLPAAVIHRGL
jgi:glucosamine kinase